MKKDCEPLPPWQNAASNSRTECKDIQSPQVSVNQGIVSLAFCGYTVWSYVGRGSDGQVDNAFNQQYQSALTKWVKARIGSRICCDKFQDAIQGSGVVTRELMSIATANQTAPIRFGQAK
jgi:hypothetical protein